MTDAQRHQATIATLKTSIRYWETRGMSIPAARASAILAKIDQPQAAK
jgi:hypothetical protein